MLCQKQHEGLGQVIICHSVSLRWRHNDQDGVSNHQPHGCLLNRLFRRRSNKTSKLRVTGLCVGNSPGPVNSPHKGPVTRKMFPFDDVIMATVYVICNYPPLPLIPASGTTLLIYTVETLYNTVNFCWSTHKRHSIARPKGRGMGCLLWVQRTTYCVDLSKLSSIKYLL